MKKILVLLILTFFYFITPISVQAIDTNPNSSVDTGEVEELYKYITNIKTEYELFQGTDIKTFVKDYMKSGEGNFSIKKLTKSLTIYAFKEVASSIKLLSMLIIIAIICSLITNLQAAFSNESLTNIAYFACYALIIVITAKSFYIGVEIAKETIYKLTDFMAALVPVLMMLLASVGGFTEAAVMDPIIIGTININARIFVNFIIPLIVMSFVLQFVNNLSDQFKINKVTKLLSQIAIWSQGIIMTVFIGIVTVRGMTSKTIDQVTVKTAKYAVDNFIPVVGKCLSDAIATVAGYSLLLKSALSSIGLVIILIIVIFPIIKILILSFVYKATAAMIEPISDSRLVNCITSAGSSLVLIMSCLISVSVMFFIMVSIIASAGKIAIGG